LLIHNAKIFYDVIIMPDNLPAIFHITHWKAGSQWIKAILRQCVPQLVVINPGGSFPLPIKEGKVYPSIYSTIEEFNSIIEEDFYSSDGKQPACYPFIIMRDLRDTLVSWYFSAKISHPVMPSPLFMERRNKLNSLSLEEGLIYLMDAADTLPACAKLQNSWAESGKSLIRYEDLLMHDVEILTRVLIDECDLPVVRERLTEVILANRFDKLTKGRQRGIEDITSHCRKAVSGDWVNYFNDKIKDAFKNRFQDVLVKTGYESNSNW